MLVLTRKKGEAIIIELPDNQGEIEIFVSDAGNDKVKLGISADKSVRILRKELKQTVETNIEATKKLDLAKIKSFMAGI